MPSPFILEDEDGNEVKLPTYYTVCERCDGEGEHDNENFNGFTQSEWAEACHDDPDFAADYMRGVYSVPCSECRGLRVVAVVNVDALEDDERKLYEDWCADEGEARRVEQYERMYGA